MTDRYSDVGVHADLAEQAKRRIAELVRGTRTALALGGIGAFGGMVRVPPGFERPVLVLSTDGVGTKVLVAARAGAHDTVGEDLVNHCVNDILVHGARPLAFLDYIATGKLEPDVATAIVTGVARGCRAHEMTLVGGETAELPDLYQPGHYDLAGTIVGIVEEAAALHGDRVRPGDQVMGYASNGLHTNGYSLARHIVFERLKLDLDDPFPETNRTVAQVLLDVHRSYAAAVVPVLPRIHALAQTSPVAASWGTWCAFSPTVRSRAGFGGMAMDDRVSRADARGRRVARRDAARVQSRRRNDRGGGARDVGSGFERRPRGCTCPHADRGSASGPARVRFTGR